jgi:hypothetical protein
MNTSDERIQNLRNKMRQMDIDNIVRTVPLGRSHVYVKLPESTFGFAITKFSNYDVTHRMIDFATEKPEE